MPNSEMMIGVEKPNLQVSFVQFNVGGTGPKLLKFFRRFGQIAYYDLNIQASFLSSHKYPTPARKSRKATSSLLWDAELAGE